MMMYGNGMGWGSMLLIPVLWIALVAVIIWAVLRLASPGGSRAQDAPTDLGMPLRETPRVILDRRFASGEIDAEAYIAAREHLVERGSRSS